MREKVRRLALAAFVAVFVVSGFLLARDLLRSRRERATNQSLAQQVHEARDAMKLLPGPSVRVPVGGEQEEPPSPYAESGLLRQYDPLWQENNDLAGWLWIDGTQIDYPVMYTPGQTEKYLRRDFYGDWALGGCLFIGEGSGPDAAHVIVFGHHMKDGAMFGDLDKYQSEDYAREHPVIHLDTLTEEREYEVIGAFRSRVYEVDEKGVFRYYQYSDLSVEENFDKYLSQVRAASLYDTGVEAAFGDRILVLSTCSYHTENGRFAVVARQRAVQDPSREG